MEGGPAGAEPPQPARYPYPAHQYRPLAADARALNIAAHEAIARDQAVGPEHLLLGLLRDAEDPVGTDLSAQQRRQRALLGLPDHGPQPIKLLVEARGLRLETLREALLSELDRDQ